MIFASIITTSGLSEIFNALICLITSIISICVNIKMDDWESCASGNKDKWLDLIFFLENYKVTNNNKSIFSNYIKLIKQETNCPSRKLVTKINQLLEKKGFEDLCFDTHPLKKTRIDTLILGCLIFGVCGMTSSLVAYSSLVNPLSVFFWISLAIFALGVVIRVFGTDDTNGRKITCIVSGIMSVLFIISVFVVGNSWEEKYNSPDYIEIEVTGKESTIEYGYSTRYKTIFSFVITNNCLKNIEYIEGKMLFYDGNKEIATSTVYFKSSIDTTQSSKMTVDFIGSDKIYQLLYSTSFDRMKIEYKITTIKFQDNETKKYDENCKVIKTSEEKKNRPFAELKDSYIGQTVTFGKFETNRDFNTIDDLEWIVVKKEGDKVLLFSKYSLLSMPFGDWSQEGYVSWKNSEIRNYLNGTFYYDCFTDEERKLIVSTTNIPSDEEIELGAVQTYDKVFIPSSSEMNQLFYSSNDMRCLSTGNIWGDGVEFGVASILHDDYHSYCGYWLRDAVASAVNGLPAQCIFEETKTSINPYSGINVKLTCNDLYYVRACMWLDLSLICE